jgi:hypothetical protein
LFASGPKSPGVRDVAAEGFRLVRMIAPRAAVAERPYVQSTDVFCSDAGHVKDRVQE